MRTWPPRALILLKMAELHFSEDNFVKKPNTKSIIWKYFSVRADSKGVPLEGEIENPVCDTCKKCVPAKRSNTTNLFRHLEDNHPLLFAEIGPETSTSSRSKSKSKQLSLSQCLNKAKAYDAKSSRATELTRAVTMFIALDMQPFYTIEKEGFRQLLQAFDPRYNLPSRRHFVDIEFPRLFSEVKEKVVKALRGTQYFAGTTDLWTSAGNHPYLSFTVHFVDMEWKLRSFCLDTVPLFDDHTGQNIADTITDILSNWELNSANLVATTTDNGSNFVSAFANYLEWPRISCFGHNLDLAINKSLNINRVKMAIERCHSLVSVFTRSWKKNRDLKQKQIELGLEQHKLISDVTTRWGSTYSMIDRIIEQQQAICAVLIEDRKNWYRMPSDQEFLCLEAVASVLKPLSLFTDALSGENSVTISSVRPLLSHITETLLAVNPSDCTVVKEMKETIASDLVGRYTDTTLSDIIDKCSYLDPRFRLNHVTYKDHTCKLIETEGVFFAEKLTTETQVQSTSEAPPPKKLKGLGSILKKAFTPDGIYTESRAHSREEIVQLEMERYKHLPSVDMEDNPLDWWKTQSQTLPILSNISKKYLCVCGTSVPSKRLFSQAGYLVNNLRTKLTPEHVNMLVFLAKNLKELDNV